MILKDEGYSVGVWDDWSRQDAARHHQGECERKWNGFSGSSQPVTVGTIVQMARDNGWSPTRSGDTGFALDWDSFIGGKDDLVIVNKDWIEGEELSEPDDWDPAQQIVTYLSILFEASESVGYVCQSWEKDGRYLPTKGNWDRTAGELIQSLGQCKGDIGSVLGDYTPEAGAWIRFNPLDGQGVKDSNVTDYRYALVESDSIDVEKQNAIIRELELPVAILVHSGGKSLHAIVKIDAADYKEYRDRVDYLYSVCKKNGLRIDSQNRNPSRLSRMPGITRNGRKQYIVDTKIGKESWAEWKEWIEGINDDLPDPESMADAWDHLPALSPALIDGVLRQGHKMLLAGPSKAGKSYALIQLCCAIAEGRRWMGFDCAQGRVMYVNLELDRASCLHRFKDVYQALQWPASHLENIDIWNLRGKSVPMDKLAPKLIRRAQKKNYIAIIIDPIYKVITGDENSADQMARFCNQFDLVCHELGAAVIYCHHHSKGSQGQKRSMDRASGSGVFARDPDALLDLIELDVDDDLLKQVENQAVCEVAINWIKQHVTDWEDEVGPDEQLSEKVLLPLAEKLLGQDVYSNLLTEIVAARKRCELKTAWRIEGTLREFAHFKPVNTWFDYPIHHIENNLLQDAQAEVEKAPWQRATEARKPKEKKKEERIQSVENAFNVCAFDSDQITVKDMADYMGITEKTVRNRIKEHGELEINDGLVERKKT